MSGKLVTAIVIGAGKRGRVYAGYALDYADQLKVETLFFKHLFLKF